MKDNFDVIIIGGGITGSLMAIALARYGLKIALIDGESKSKFQTPLLNSRSYSLTASSKCLLEALDLWEEVKIGAQPIYDITISDGLPEIGAKLFFLEFEDTHFDEGAMAYMVEDRVIRPLIYNFIGSCININHFVSTTVTDFDIQPGYAGVTLSNKCSLRANLLIGADGTNSITAKYAGIKGIGWKYDQSSLVGIVKHEVPHNGQAHQFFMPNGPIAILPLTESRSAFVWTEKKFNAEQLHKLDEPTFLAELEKRFGKFRGKITLVGSRHIFPLSFRIADCFFGDRVALIGDAAHNIHPIAGQGLNLGIKDVASLAETLVYATRLGQDIGSTDILERYSNWRKFDVLSMGVFTDFSNRVFSNDNSISRLTRGFGLFLISQNSTLKKAIVKEAAGISGDTPKLMRGDSI